MKRIPANGDFRTNIHAGATPAKHELTDSDLRICNAIADRLVKDGLYFVGVDIIGDKLVEINVVSPGGIPRINRLDGVTLESPGYLTSSRKKVAGHEVRPLRTPAKAAPRRQGAGPVCQTEHSYFSPELAYNLYVPNGRIFKVIRCEAISPLCRRELIFYRKVLCNGPGKGEYVGGQTENIFFVANAMLFGNYCGQYC